MSIEPIGLLSALVGLLVLYWGPNFGIYAVAISSLLGAASIGRLPGLGDANIAPVHAILVPYVITVLRSSGTKTWLRTLAFPSPGFWATAFVAFCLMTAALMPRIFEGAIDVLSISRNQAGQGGLILTPLMPRPSNITQSIYLAADLVLFTAVAVHAMGGALTTIVRAILVAAMFNIGFAGLDLMTYVTGTTDVMSIIRNANYGMQVGVAIGGVKRVVGSFTEASAFGGVTLLFFAFSTELWLQGKFRRVAGPIAALSLAAIILATSSSTYVGFSLYCLILWMRCAFSVFVGRANTRKLTVSLVAPPVAVGVIVVMMLMPSVSDPIVEIIDSTLLNKLNTQSGVERWYWNENGMRVFHETAMLGAGVGSVRASSLVVGLLANVGIGGLVLFLIFIASLCLTAMRGARDPDIGAYVTASAWASFTLLATAILAASGVDLGLFFFILAAIVSQAVQAPVRQPYPAVRHKPLGAWRRESAYGL